MTGATGKRGVMEVDWPFFGELCRALALKVAREYEPDIIIGIAKAGVIPGAVVASIFQCDFASMIVTRRAGHGAPLLIAGPPPLVERRRVLLVDETCHTGDTLKVATTALRRQGPLETRSAVSFKTGVYQPDYHALETDNIIILPWDRLVIEDGELVTRPDYAQWLEEE